jgi:hypothetical protein
MPVTFPAVRVGQPLRYQSLAVFPLFTPQTTPLDYWLSDEGIGRGTVTVEEVSETGSVPELMVENKGDVRVLFLEGEQLVGAKQNRVLNTSVLIAAKSKIKIPVSCVEQGRWRYRSAQFGSSGTHSPSKLRYCLKESVTKSLRESRGHSSDQGRVWAEVARQQSSLGTSSGTVAMEDTFSAYQDRLAEFRQQLQYVEGASGVAVAIGKKVVAVDVFDKPSTCSKVWDRLLSGFVLDALEAASEEAQPETADTTHVEQLLCEAGGMPWEQVQPVGEGEEYRADTPAQVHGSALTLASEPIHVSVLAAV